MTSEQLQIVLESTVSQKEKRTAIRERQNILRTRDKEHKTLTAALLSSYEIEFGD